MARKTNHQFERKKREQARTERAAARRARKRGKSSSPGGPEGSLNDDDLVAGPQQAPKASDAEIQAAIERAMNPGAVRQRVREKQGPGIGARLFVGNLDFGTDEAELRDLFTEGGYTVVSATVVKDRDTGRPRGFGFVELAGPEEAAKAMEALDGAEFAGRELRVNPADQR